MIELLGLTTDELTSLVVGLGEKPFRAKQLDAYLVRGVPLRDMRTLPASLRERLIETAIDCPAEILESFASQLDDTVKFLFRLCDGNVVEGVLMSYHYGYTLCLSTQVGCRMGCLFCASTLEGCVRNLTAAEMLGMVVCVNRYLGERGRVGHIVLMGSGEPLDNYEQTTRFLRLVRRQDGLCVGLRNVSLSTCGLVPQMIRFTQEDLPVTLSVSLHAPNDVVRRRIMPIANTYPISQVLDACRGYLKKTGRRIIFEYALMDGVNAEPAHALELASLLRGMQCHVNVIPLNEVRERGLRGVTSAQVKRFLDTLDSAHISATRRREMGDDIQGACGQLRRHMVGAGHE